MTEKLPLPAQIRAVETARGVIQSARLRASERELMDARLCAVIRTLAYLRRHEAAFREFIAQQTGPEGGAQ